MFRRGKRGQITVFVLLAFVLLIVFSFALYARIMMNNRISDAQLSNQIKDYIDQNSVNLYVNSCLDVILEEAVLRAGMQGGRIYFDGLTKDVDYIERYDPSYNRTFNITISVIENNCSLVDPYPPEYPYPDVEVMPSSVLNYIYYNDPATCRFYTSPYYSSSGFFGLNRLPKLCSWNSSNRPYALGNITYGAMTCEIDSYNNMFSDLNVQHEMEEYIKKNIANCVNFTLINERTSANVTVIDDPSATITFGSSSIGAGLQYPFFIKIGNRQPVMRMVNFSIERSIPFKEMYEYAIYAAKADTQEAAYDITLDKIFNSDLQKKYHGYNIARIRPTDRPLVDLIRIQHPTQLIEGKNFTIQFGVKNRRPALDLIREYSGYEQIDILVAENQTLTIKPQGYDPDEDVLVYNYSMWKEDYDESYNFDDPLCATPNDFNYIKNHCMTKIPNSKPKNFTNSYLFKSTGQNASYIVDKNDRGYHVLKVMTKEKFREGLDDWQNVTIFVFDKPEANITGSNMFSPEIPWNMASFEDVYLLNGSSSKAGTFGELGINGLDNGITKFIWNDSFHEFDIEKLMTPGYDQKLFLPKDTNGTEYNIINITNLTFSRFIGTNTHKISLTVITSLGFTDTESIDVNVKQCLPHRDPTKPSYPYNKDPPQVSTLLEIFNANHTCCNDVDYTYKGVTAVCYNATAYGTWRKFKDYTQYPLTPNYPITYFPTGSTIGTWNDVYQQDFTRNCEAERGNICGGAITEIRTQIHACDDTNYMPSDSYRKEKCSGPNPIGPSPTEMICGTYPFGTTFEKLIGAPGATGKCTDGPQCSNGASLSSTGAYECDGGCNAGTCNKIWPNSCSCASRCGSDPLCDGLRLGEQLGIVCTFDNHRFQDECDTCISSEMITEGEHMCRKNVPGQTTNCNAPAECDGILTRHIIPPTNNQYCSSNCDPTTCASHFAYNEGAKSCYGPTCSHDYECATNYYCIGGACVPQ